MAPKYEAEFEIDLYGEDLAHFVEALREQGHPKLVLRVEADTRAKAANAMAESTSGWWGYSTYDRDWWAGRLRAIRGKRAAEDI